MTATTPVPNAAVRADPDRRVCHVDAPLTVPVLAALHPVELADGGHRVLHLHPPALLGDDELDLRLIRLLRECLSAGLDVRWTAEGPLRWPLAMMRHLPPPATGHDQWRQQFIFGLCYYRMGPDFITIRDTRQGGEHGARFVLDDAGALLAWPALEGVLHLPAASPAARQLVDMLAEEDLVFAAGDWVTLLPFRMRRWPVPESEV